MHERFGYIDQDRTTGLTPPSRTLCHIKYWCSTFTIWHLHCLCVKMYLIFNPWWMFSPPDRLMCTKKTCFAGVVTGPKTIFRIKNSFPFVSMRIRKNSNISVSGSNFDSRCKPGVFAEPVLAWNLIFVLLSKILWSFITVICSTNSSSHRLSRECGTYTFGTPSTHFIPDSDMLFPYS